MYEKFTDRARKVMQLANQEARRLNHEYIGTEHILLGLLKEGLGVGANVLKNQRVDLERMRLEIEKIAQSGPDLVLGWEMLQTPRARKVIEYAIGEARSFNDKHVGTEHLLLGLLSEWEGVAAQVLMNFGLTLADARQELLRIRDQNRGPAVVFSPQGAVLPPTAGPPEQKFLNKASGALEPTSVSEASGTFEVKLTPIDTGDAKMGMMMLEKQYHGDLTATGKGRMLTGMTDVKTSAAYVAIERVEGKLKGAEGTFLLQHTGVMTKERQSLVIRVVPDSGTGALAGIEGEMHVKIENGKHFYRLAYTLGQKK